MTEDKATCNKCWLEMTIEQIEDDYYFICPRCHNNSFTVQGTRIKPHIPEVDEDGYDPITYNFWPGMH